MSQSGVYGVGSGVAIINSVTGGNNITTTGTATDPVVNVSGTTDNAIQVGNATNSLTSLAVGETGEIIIGVTGADPAWLAAGTSGQVLTANGAGNAPTWDSNSSISWSREVGAAVAAVADGGYINTNVALTTITLPATAAVGTIIEIVGESAAGWTIAQNAGQNIQYGNLSTTVGIGGSLSSSHRYDTVRLVCRVTDTTWSVISVIGVLKII